jgi:hypothetical protein
MFQAHPIADNTGVQASQAGYMHLGMEISISRYDVPRMFADFGRLIMFFLAVII